MIPLPSFDTGTGDMLSVGCVHVTPSAASLYTAMEYAKSSGHTPNMDPLADPKEEDMWNCVSKLVVDFESTNPGAEMNKVVVIRNYRLETSILNVKAY